MSVEPDDLEVLLQDVRKTINDNKLFLKTLGDEQTSEDEEEEGADGTDLIPGEDDFEEL